MTKTTDRHPDKEELTIITTHINADFDAISSMVAAQKLYPDAKLVFPGSIEKNIRNFFINSMIYMLNMIDINDVDPLHVKTLVLVDTRQAKRIGKLSTLADKKDVEIHLYDHHPAKGDDLHGTHEIYKPYGATVTILIELIREKGIELTPDEATVLSLGIYEDTGSFTFSSTTENDFMAAAYLLSKGASLNTIADMISREINPDQVSLLNDMIQSANTYNINGVDVVLTTVSTETYVPDFAFLVHKMVKMENINAIIAVARMTNKIYIVGRSRIPEVDVGSIVAPFGGGGHSYAAAAAIKDKTLAQAESLLLEILHQKIRSKRRAKNLMTTPALSILPEITCKEASRIMTRCNINALLVLENQATAGDLLYGYVTRQIVEKALSHELDDVAVQEYMTRDIATVSPEADLPEIQEKIIAKKQRILPVIEKDKVIGVVTRTDLLNTLVRQTNQHAKDGSDLLKEPFHTRTRNVQKFMKERLSDKVIDTLKSIGEVAHEAGYKSYVVGGFVRDLFLYRPNEDIDIVVEGDGIAFAKKYAALNGARIHTYAKFGTAVIIFPDGFKIDVASARLEYYKFPAALPTVEMSSIKLDLFRRDFTINTLAIQLTPSRFGMMVDFFAALNDLKDKSVRVLHNLSFVEDPTRVFRAIRFEQRFGFNIGKLTSSLINNAEKMNFFSRLSGRRVFTEIKLILEEENPTLSIARMNDYGLLKVIHPEFLFDPAMESILNSVKKTLSWYDLLFLEEPYMKWAVYFLVLIRNYDIDAITEICDRLELAPRHKHFFCKDRRESEKCLFWLKSRKDISNGELFHRLASLKTEFLLYMMAAEQEEYVKRYISNYILKLRHVRLQIKGRDLQKMGLKPGPFFSKILDAVLEAKLNGELKTRSDELLFAEKYV
ncbi:MAG: CBS domain-containing protein [Desulfobacterales bacterium]|nr:CBS domain-containing protein [Desulfobacterales bacterium]